MATANRPARRPAKSSSKQSATAAVGNVPTHVLARELDARVLTIYGRYAETLDALPESFRVSFAPLRDEFREATSGLHSLAERIAHFDDCLETMRRLAGIGPTLTFVMPEPPAAPAAKPAAAEPDSATGDGAGASSSGDPDAAQAASPDGAAASAPATPAADPPVPSSAGDAAAAGASGAAPAGSVAAAPTGPDKSSADPDPKPDPIPPTAPARRTVVPRIGGQRPGRNT